MRSRLIPFITTVFLAGLIVCMTDQTGMTQPQENQSQGTLSQGTLTQGNQSQENQPQATQPQESQTPALSPPLLPDQEKKGAPIDTPKSQGSFLETSLKLFGCLAIVLGLYMLLMYLVRKTPGLSSPHLPEGLVTVVGRCQVEGKPVVVIQFGPKLVLTSVTPTGLLPIAELPDSAVLQQPVATDVPQEPQGVAT